MRPPPQVEQSLMSVRKVRGSWVRVQNPSTYDLTRSAITREMWRRLASAQLLPRSSLSYICDYLQVISDAHTL